MAAPRSRRGRHPQVDIDAEAYRLYERFHSYAEVGRLMGCTAQTAAERVERAAWSPDSVVATERNVALARLNTMAQIALSIAEAPHVAHSNGRVIFDPASGAPLRDSMPNLQALDRLQRIEDQRSKLLGLYAPLTTRIEIVPRDVVEALVAENERVIAAAERELGLVPGAPIEREAIETTASVSVAGAGDDVSADAPGRMESPP